jgi:ABC-2 type transport system permease protein
MRFADRPLALLVRVNALQLWRRVKALREQSRLLTGIITLFIIGYWVLAFELFYRGLRFLNQFPGLGELLIERLVFLLFAFLFAMLLLSNLVIGYTNLFRNRETTHLWSLPVPAQTIFQWKFLESMLLASWAFVFLVLPLLLAFGLMRGAGWHFYLVTAVSVALFIVLPGAAGSWVAVTLARFLDRRTFQVVGLLLVGGVVAGVGFYLKPQPMPPEESLETRILPLLDQLLGKTRFSQYPWLPSYWLSATVVQWAEGALGGAGFFLLVLLSHALFFGLLAFTQMGRVFYDGASMVQSRGSVLGRWGWFQRWRGRPAAFGYERGALERLAGLGGWLRPDVQAMIVKDARVFWRDTTQWGQTLMLFGLLGVYIVNLRHFSEQLVAPFWVFLVSFLNLGACSLNLATLTTRFVYPQFSLEGRRLWIVGMAPLGLPRMIVVKFWLASLASLAVTLGLVTLSCHFLQLPWERFLYFVAAVTIMTFTLNGLAVGLGALYPNLKEDNPGKIVSGFGGTLCLVVSFLYILAAVLLLATGSPWSRWGRQMPELLIGSWTGFAVLSVLVGWLPFKFGLRRVAAFEV